METTIIEEWKPVPTWEGIYQCSNFGRIKRYFKHHNSIKKATKDNNGYYIITLSYKNRKEKWKLHRLVATVWKRPLNTKEDCHHKNKFLWCNCKFNIQIVDHDKHLEEYHNTKSQQTKKKMSQSHKGLNTWSKGSKKSPEETQKRLQTLKQKRLIDPNYGKRTGVKCSEETKAKISASEKGKTAWNKGKTLSQQHKRKISEAKRKKFV